MARTGRLCAQGRDREEAEGTRGTPDAHSKIGQGTGGLPGAGTQTPRRKGQVRFIRRHGSPHHPRPGRAQGNRLREIRGRGADERIEARMYPEWRSRNRIVLVVVVVLVIEPRTPNRERGQRGKTCASCEDSSRWYDESLRV